MARILVAGAGGFIGGHLVKALLDQGHYVRGVDIKRIDDWWQKHLDVGSDQYECWSQHDLRWDSKCSNACYGMDMVYQLAARMGGIGEIETHHCDCAMNVVLSANMLLAAKERGVDRFLYSSSACVYHSHYQADTDVIALREYDIEYCGGHSPEEGYGHEKLFSEMLCRWFSEDYGLETRVARLHNVYGPWGSWQGGREKAPAAICRKVIEAVHTGKHEIEVWGDGNQTRSFMWIDDCIKGLQLIMDSDYREPLNLGSSELVTINQLVDMAEEIAGVSLQRNYNLTAPKGVRGRNSDNTRIKRLFKWEPRTPLRVGLEKTYKWIEEQYLRGRM
jgi:nucleoside-diphosphate-sugar epimerase